MQPAKASAIAKTRKRDVFITVGNDELRHPYRRVRASVTGLGLWSGKIIETERLRGVALPRLLVLLLFSLGRDRKKQEPDRD